VIPNVALLALIVKSLAWEDLTLVGQWLEERERVEIPEFSTSNPQFQQAFQRVAKAEQKPLQRIEEREKKIENKLGLVRDFKQKVSDVKTALMGMRNVRDFRELKGTSSDPDILDVSSIDKSKATPGKYDFEVLNLANTDSIMTYGFGDPKKSEVGVGYVEFKTPDGETKEVYINSDNNSLEGVASSINKANLGIKAYVVQDGTDSDEPWRLVITGDETGWKNDFEWPTFYLLDGDLEFDTERSRDAKSAIVRFNGQPVMLQENKINDILPGISIDLKKAKPGEPIFFEVGADIAKMGEKVQTLVDSSNAVLKFIQDQNSLGSKSYGDPTKALGGDVTIQALENRFRTLIQRTTNDLPGSPVQRMADLGIQFNRSGLLDFDAEKFQSVLNNNFDDVAALVSGTQPLEGFANEMISLVDGIVRSGDGMMTVREKNLQGQLDRMAKEKEKTEGRVEQKLQRAKEEFGRAEAAIQEMQNMSAQIGGGGGGVNSLIG